jgi:hypothetical protein
VKSKGKTRIRSNGHDQSGPGDLSSKAKGASHKLKQGKPAAPKTWTPSAAETELPDEVGGHYADIMSVVQNNGHVTLPSTSFHDEIPAEPSARGMRPVVGAIGLMVLFILLKRFA